MVSRGLEMSYITPPIRCLECGAVVGHLWELYWKLAGIDVENGFTKKEGLKEQIALDKLNVKKPCCRNMLQNSICYDIN